MPAREVPCDNCENPTPSSKVRLFGTKVLCPDCYRAAVRAQSPEPPPIPSRTNPDVPCDHCGYLVPAREVRLYGKEQLCKSCFANARDGRKRVSSPSAEPPTALSEFSGSEDPTNGDVADDHSSPDSVPSPPKSAMNVPTWPSLFPDIPPGEKSKPSTPQREDQDSDTSHTARATFVALLCGWSSLWAVVWMAGFGAIVGLAIGGVAGAFTVGLVVAFAGLGAGALVFGLYGVALFVASILYSALMMLLGWGCAFLITRLAMRTEPWRMTIRGYRRLSDRESLVVVPLVDEIAAAMTVKTLPTILIHDIPAPGAWTHTQHVVLSKRSLDLERRELAAMIAHEMHHYRSGDAKKGIFIWACAFPVAFLAEFQKLVRDRGGKLLSFLIGIFLWPAVVMLRFAIAAAMGADNRQREYAADAAVVDAGYGDGFIRLLETIRVFEPGRSNWDSVMAATHPPIEFRIEAVQRRLSPPEIELQTLPPLPADSPM